MRRRQTAGILSLAALAVGVALSGCSPSDRPKLAALPAKTHAAIPGIPDARSFSDQPEVMEQELERALVREGRHLGLPKGSVLPPASFLALSGGGDDGAYGAGLLAGWTARGDRPEFKMVTGVSTGALIAPFAFLGRDYDSVLKDVYTNSTPDSIYAPRFIVTAALTDDALADTTPLYETISRHVDDALMAKIAAEYRKGRLLFIQTTDLDAGLAVRWNIGAIAESGAPGALTLIRRILLASASIPAAFPPVMFDVEIEGQPHQELHVDGGAVSQSFLLPPGVSLREARREAGYKRRSATAYIIRNSRLTVAYSDVDRRTLPIAQKAVSTLINYNGRGDLYRMYTLTKVANVGFNLAYIDEDFQAPHKEDFDQTYMRALYAYGFDKAAHGFPWRHTPPGLDASARD
ncbi:putative patatin/cPLA2 family phospholipase [Rhodoblastus acidophilus]|uniref:patatin-like phospholipase family protein n=1 Tax=Rhodoblastus acidophilus TaxID=1074 RepID=UPI0022241E66|nr:patatin-like phospholipase family protein [Rhodoblastus acidophilus]MCW2282616.1 putative patatin/cPLA2 family phospholipase [Rhodoblastus acidophilus]MCW2331477.1 putative patatin/cPLA2 family phospholipase [Rhodoblastus acidophilus]